MNTRYLIPMFVLFLGVVIWFTYSFDHAIASKSDFYINEFPIVDSEASLIRVGVIYNCFESGSGYSYDGLYTDVENSTKTVFFSKVIKKPINEVNHTRISELCHEEVSQKKLDKEKRIKELVSELSELITHD